MPHYVLFSRKAQGVLVRKVAESAFELAAQEPETFEFCPRTGNRDGMIRILRTPEDNDPRGRTQAYQALTRRHRQQRVDSRSVDPDQLDLLELLEQTGPESDIVDEANDDM